MAAWCVVLIYAEFDALWPYQLSRWVLCSGSVILSFRLGFDTPRGALACAIAILFNPIAPIHFGDVWPTIDGIAAIGLVMIVPNPSNFKKEDWIRWSKGLWNGVQICFLWLFVAFGAVLIVYSIWDIASGNMAKRDVAKAEAEKNRWKSIIDHAWEGVNARNQIPEAERMVLDFDQWQASPPDVEREQLEGYLQSSPDRERAKRHITAQLVVSEASGIAPDAVDSDWEMIRRGFAKDRQWDGAGVDDDTFFEKLKSELQFFRKERQLLRGPDDEKAPDAADKRKLSLVSQVEEAAFTGVPFADAFATWQEQAKTKTGWRENRYPQHELIGREIYDKTAATLAKVKPIADEVFTTIDAYRKGVPGDIAPFLLIRGQTPQERDATFRLMTQGADGKPDKSRTLVFTEGIGRFMERAEQERRTGSKGTSDDGSRIARELLIEEATKAKK